MLDLLIKNARIINGSGAPSTEGDVGIAGDRIVAVGDAPSTARRIIDGTGLTLTPGFIDLHTHYDGQVLGCLAYTLVAARREVAPFV